MTQLELDFGEEFAAPQKVHNKYAEIEHMWKIATNDPNHDTNWYDPRVILFANLVIEECAKVCEARYMGDNNREDMEAKRCAEAIRAMGQ